MAESSISHWLDVNYRQVIYLVFLIALIIPIFSPLGLAITPSQKTRDFFEAIDSLESGSIIMMGNQMGSVAWPEIGSVLPAVMQHIFDKDLRVIAFTYGEEAALLFIEAMKEVDTSGKTYGEDWVITTFMSGPPEVVYARTIEDFYSVEFDYYMTPIQDVPLMKEAKNGYDVSLYVQIESGYYAPYAVRQMSEYTEIIASTIGSHSPSITPFYETGQIKGLIVSARGVAEYEKLVGHPGEATLTFDAQSLGHVVAICAVILGNIAEFRRKKND